MLHDSLRHSLRLAWLSLGGSVADTKNHVWYQHYSMTIHALDSDRPLMAIRSIAKLDVSSMGKKKTIRQHLEEMLPDQRVSSQARDLLLLTSKVEIGDQ